MLWLTVFEGLGWVFGVVWTSLSLRTFSLQTRFSGQSEDRLVQGGYVPDLVSCLLMNFTLFILKTIYLFIFSLYFQFSFICLFKKNNIRPGLLYKLTPWVLQLLTFAFPSK